MLYVSTRGGSPLPFADVLLEGLAPNGGLYVPESYPQVTPQQLDQWREILAGEGYAGLAFEVLRLLIDDMPEDDLRGLCAAAYSEANFGSGLVAPVTQIGDAPMYLAHLSNGPTASFKDMAMQLLGRLFERELARRGQTLTVLGATSGDTGSAAEHALLGRAGVRVAMLTPAGRMTPFQTAQMYAIDDPAIANIAVDGVFDDCQDLVKAVNMDAPFKAAHHIGAVNSINVSRVLAQVVYAFGAWLQVASSNESVSFAVPTGNFGDIMSVFVAKQMGLPVADMILATNENNILAEFFATGIYRPRGAAETVATSTPAMDISKASNLERFIFDLLGRDPGRIQALFGEDIPGRGFFDLSDDAAFAAQRARYGIVSGMSTHADRVATIAALWREHGVLIDPHTAAGVHVAQTLIAQNQVRSPVIAYETALPVKFSETIMEAIGEAPPVPARFAGLERAPQHFTRLDNDVSSLKAWLAAW